MVVPHNSFELREHLQLRWDAFERNILSLPHEGFAAGGDLVHGNRIDWKNWGVDGSQAAGEGSDYLSFTACLSAAGGVPGVRSDRDRLLGTLHGGVGYNLDRFSAPRVVGGLQTMGGEYGSTWRPILPGAVIREFFPKHYLIATGEYRRELLFFTYLSLDGSVGWLDRLEKEGNGTVSKNKVFSALGIENLSLFSEGFPTRFACGNDSFEPRTDFEIGSNRYYFPGAAVPAPWRPA